MCRSIHADQAERNRCLREVGHGVRLARNAGEENDTLMTALERFGFEVDAGYENPDDVVIKNYNDKYGNEIVIALETLAPFAVEGTVMQWQG